MEQFAGRSRRPDGAPPACRRRRKKPRAVGSHRRGAMPRSGTLGTARGFARGCPCEPTPATHRYVEVGTEPRTKSTHTPRAGGAKDGGARMGPMSIHVCLCALPRRSAKRPPGCVGRCSFDHSIRNETANGALGFDDSLQFRTARLYAGERVRFSSRTTDGVRPVQRLKAYLKEVGRS